MKSLLTLCELPPPPILIEITYAWYGWPQKYKSSRIWNCRSLFINMRYLHNRNGTRIQGAKWAQWVVYTAFSWFYSCLQSSSQRPPALTTPHFGNLGSATYSNRWPFGKRNLFQNSATFQMKVAELELVSFCHHLTNIAFCNFRLE